MIDLSNWITQLPAWLIQAWHWIGHIFHAVLVFLGASEREKISTAVWKNADGTIAKIITTTDTIPAKTVWDLLALLGSVSIPIVVVLLTIRFQSQLKKQEQEEEKEKALENYLDQVSEILIQNDLIQLATDDSDSSILFAAKGVIRARTLLILKKLNDARNKTVVEFLVEAKIIEGLKLDFDEANFKEVDLRAANFQSINLRRADFSNSDLRGVCLQEANLQGANLSHATLFGANLGKTNFFGANLEGATLCKSCMHEANLIKAKLRNADLRMASLWGADLRMADLSGAKLSLTDLSDVFFEDTIMPDGIARSGEDAQQYIKTHYL